MTTNDQPAAPVSPRQRALDGLKHGMEQAKANDYALAQIYVDAAQVYSRLAVADAIRASAAPAVAYGPAPAQAPAAALSAVAGTLCACGKTKRPQFDVCFTCNQSKQASGGAPPPVAPAPATSYAPPVAAAPPPAG